MQLELVRAVQAVALLPALALPPADPSVVLREVAEAPLGRRLVLVTREGAAAPALAAFTAVLEEVTRAVPPLDA